MPRFQPGDVLTAYLPYRDKHGNINCKLRPVVVIRVEGPTENLHVACTGTDRRGDDNVPGKWIPAKTPLFFRMGLDKSSYLKYCDPIILDDRDIVRKIGTIPEELLVEIDEVI